MGIYKIKNRVSNKEGKIVGYTISVNGSEAIIPRKDILKLRTQQGNPINGKITSDGRVVAKIPTVEQKLNKKMILYHGSPNERIVLNPNGGNDRHDFGRGFYLTPSIELASEWSSCIDFGNDVSYVHKYEVDLQCLKIFNFTSVSTLSWLAELIKHRAGDTSSRYRKRSAEFIRRFGISIDGYDIIVGWRADASYFLIAKEFARGNINVNILERLLNLGDLGLQYVLKTEKAYKSTKEVATIKCNRALCRKKYLLRDSLARENMRKLIFSDENDLSFDIGEYL